MMSSIQLANRFREVILNGKWIANTNVQDQLRNVTLEQAVTEIDNLNTIAKLTFHLNYYISGVLNVFEGGDLEIRDKFSFDLPKMNSEQEWNDLTTNLFSNAEKFANHVEHMSEEKLNAEFVNTDYGDFRRNIEGIIEHSYYHLGQIVLLRKMLDQ
ncbi:DinB family protein [Ulvibacterium marinum]|uniref:DinB family protein n=1 Tax=Ulvibacterium marinum TaxID=2419782 RepID=UPI00249523A5|nr:DinB family protein [Ulvibacterium marinum]